MLSCQAKIDEWRTGRIFLQWLSGYRQTVCQQFDIHQGISKQTIDSAGEGIQPVVGDSPDYHRAYRRTAQDFPHHQRHLLRQTSQLWKNLECEFRDCEVETALDRSLNGIVVLAAEITVTTWIYYGKMSNIAMEIPSSPTPRARQQPKM